MILNETGFIDGIDKQELLSIKIIFLAMLMGPIAFSGVLFFMYTIQNGVATGNIDSIIMMSKVTVGFTILGYIFAYLIYKKRLSKKTMEKFIEIHKKENPLDKNIENSPDLYFAEIRTAKIIVSSTMQGVTFFGLVVVFMSVIGNDIDTNPILLLNLIPFIIYVLYSIFTFPTKENLKQLFRKTYM